MNFGVGTIECIGGFGLGTVGAMAARDAAAQIAMFVNPEINVHGSLAVDGLSFAIKTAKAHIPEPPADANNSEKYPSSAQAITEPSIYLSGA